MRQTTLDVGEADSLMARTDAGRNTEPGVDDLETERAGGIFRSLAPRAHPYGAAAFERRDAVFHGVLDEWLQQ